MMHNSSDDSEWAVRPSGTLVPEHLHHRHNQQQSDAASAEFGPAINICIAHGSSQHELQVPEHATFGDVKKVLTQRIGLEPVGLKILFRGQEKEDAEQLRTAGVKDKSKIVVVEDPKKKEEQMQQQQPGVTEAMAKALAGVVGVRAEVDKLSERVTALEIAVNGGTKVAPEEFDMTAELLMRLLLKLDGIEAEGEARVQRKAEVRRVQNFHEILDNLKARNSNPFVDNKAVSVTTEWETFNDGVGSLNPPPQSSSSTKITQDWEQFE